MCFKFTRYAGWVLMLNSRVVFLGEIHAIFLAFDSLHLGNLGSGKVVVLWIMTQQEH